MRNDFSKVNSDASKVDVDLNLGLIFRLHPAPSKGPTEPEPGGLAAEMRLVQDGGMEKR